MESETAKEVAITSTEEKAEFPKNGDEIPKVQKDANFNLMQENQNSEIEMKEKENDNENEVKTTTLADSAAAIPAESKAEEINESKLAETKEKENLPNDQKRDVVGVISAPDMDKEEKEVTIEMKEETEVADPSDSATFSVGIGVETSTSVLDIDGNGDKTVRVVERREIETSVSSETVQQKEIGEGNEADGNTQAKPQKDIDLDTRESLNEDPVDRMTVSETFHEKSDKMDTEAAIRTEGTGLDSGSGSSLEPPIPAGNDNEAKPAADDPSLAEKHGPEVVARPPLAPDANIGKGENSIKEATETAQVIVQAPKIDEVEERPSSVEPINNPLVKDSNEPKAPEKLLVALPTTTHNANVKDRLNKLEVHGSKDPDETAEAKAGSKEVSGKQQDDKTMESDGNQMTATPNEVSVNTSESDSKAVGGDKESKPESMTNGSTGNAATMASKSTNAVTTSEIGEKRKRDDTLKSNGNETDTGSRKRLNVDTRKDESKVISANSEITKAESVKNGPTNSIAATAALKPKSPPKSPANPDALKMIVITNDGDEQNLIWLISAKEIFAVQLPRMPKEYIVRLVMDRKHYSLLCIKSGEVVGGICFRPYLDQRFAEIAFCAVSASHQVKGYGTILMNHLKQYVKTIGLTHFLTYADNYAIGYFKKQGFTKQLTMHPDRWMGYIKDYDGGTLMECAINPCIDYLNIAKMLHSQKQFLMSKIKSMSKSNIVYPGLNLFQEGRVVTNIYEEVPGVLEAGWTAPVSNAKEMASLGQDHELQRCLQDFLRKVTAHKEAWPFHEPVPDSVTDYLEVIHDPVDLSLIKKRLSHGGYYKSVNDMIADLRKMCDNCRIYNQKNTQYYQAADLLQAYFDPLGKEIEEQLHARKIR